MTYPFKKEFEWRGVLFEAEGSIEFEGPTDENYDDEFGTVEDESFSLGDLTIDKLTLTDEDGSELVICNGWFIGLIVDLQVDTKLKDLLYDEVYEFGSEG